MTISTTAITSAFGRHDSCSSVAIHARASWLVEREELVLDHELEDVVERDGTTGGEHVEDLIGRSRPSR